MNLCFLLVLQLMKNPSTPPRFWLPLMYDSVSSLIHKKYIIQIAKLASFAIVVPVGELNTKPGLFQLLSLFV